MPRLRRRWAGLAARCLLATALVLPAFAGAANAATWNVTTTTDSQDDACTASLCSLRDAVAAASAGDVVEVPSSDSHYVLTLGQIPITQAITIRGVRASSSVIDAQSRSRLFIIRSGIDGTVTFDRVTLTGGHVTASGTGPVYGGGAVFAELNSGNEVFTHAALTDNSVTVSGDANGHVGGGAIYDTGHNLTIIHSTLARNSLTATSGGQGFNGGGAIWDCPYPSSAPMRITASTLRANTSVTNGNTGAANGGGAIYNTCSTLIIDRSTLADNSATADGNHQRGGPGNNGGGAIFNDSGSSVTVVGSTVIHNTATADGDTLGSNGGGGILIQVGTLLIDRSTIADNTANVIDEEDYDGGGGILNAFSSGMTIRSSTISGNTANLAGATARYSGGGGVADNGTKPSSYTNTTVTGNTTNVHDGAGNGGGGIIITGGAMLTNMTLVGNTSGHAAGGGLLAASASGFATLKSSILARNSAPNGTGACGVDSTGRIASLGYNLEYGAICTAATPTDKLDGNPRLGPLRRNGGPTRTLALLPGSAAINAIPRSACTDQTKPPEPVTSDQRGVRRSDHRCDIGAYERAANARRSRR
jgi:CSLREA domain-containing protein